MQSQDMGHIAHRRWRQTYESSVFEFENSAAKGRLKFDADVPAGTDLVFEARTAPDAGELSSQRWAPLQESTFNLQSGDRAFQYRAVFTSANGDRYPSLDRVEIDLESGR